MRLKENFGVRMWGGVAVLVAVAFSKVCGKITVECPDGWETFPTSRTCYRIFDESKDFDRAEMECNNYQGHLASIKDKNTKDFIAKRVGESQQGDKKEGYWVGLKMVGEGFEWIDGGKPEVIGWADGEPSPNTPPACGTILALGLLASEECSGVEKRFICSRDLAIPPRCNDGWKLYGDYCYKMITANKQKKKTFEMAEKKCESMNGNLPIIKSQAENELITMFASQLDDGGKDIWIGIIETPWWDIVWLNNDTVKDGYNNWFHSDDNNQPVIMEGNGRGLLSVDDGKWFLANKDEPKYYICQQKAGAVCYKGMIGHNNMCYTFNLDVNTDVDTFEGAAEKCYNYNMTLPRFDNSDSSEWFNQKLIELDEFPAESEVQGVWIGLQETATNTEKFIWRDPQGGDHEMVFDGRKDNLTYHSDKLDCFWFGMCDNTTPDAACSTPTTKDKRWINDVCDADAGGKNHVFACQMEKGTYIDVSSVLKPEKSCPEGWSLFVDNCYLYRSDEESWQTANQWCTEKGGGSNLVSLHSQAENEFVAGLLPMDVTAWIGLNRRSTSNWVWSDRTSGYKYSNWLQKPDDEAPEKCANIGSNGGNGGRWSGQVCTDLSGYICEKPATTGGSDSTTTAAPDNHNCGYHGDTWTEDPFTGMCYQVIESTLTWSDARDECNSLAGYDDMADLASISTYQEQVFITSLLKGRDDDSSVWIGLSDGNNENSFVWSDGNPVAYINWNDGEPNSYFESEDCVEVKPAEGFGWNDERCDQMKPAICEKRGRNYRPPQPPPAPKVQCAPGWMELDGKCFYFKTNTTIHSFKLAEAECQGLNPVAHLASVSSQKEMDWIKDGKLGEHAVFIGARKDDDSWSWLDGSSWDYTNWGQNQPDGGPTDNCIQIEMYKGEGNSEVGWWNDVSCDKPASGFICSYDNFLCPPNWKTWGDSCWYSSDSADSYEGAVKACTDMSAHAKLAAIYNEFENWFVKDYEQQVGTDFGYIGVHWEGNSWTWPDHSNINFTHNWSDSLPGPESGECVLVSQDGDWSTANCSEQHRYTCRMPAKNFLGCPLGWSLYGYNCYLVQDELWTWSDAEKQCGLKGGDLASILSWPEQQEIFSIIHSGPNCPEGYIFDNNGCVGLTFENRTWADSNAACQEADAHMFYVLDKSYQDVLERNIQNDFYIGEHVWLGAKRLNASAPWTWGNGQEMTYLNWVNPEASKQTGCAVIRKSDYKWSVSDCNIDESAFICTKNQSPDQAPRWIGLSDQSSFNSFEWSDGNPVLFTQWGNKNPVNVGNDPACVYMDSLWGGWKSAACDETKGSICKMPAIITGPPDNDGCQAGEIAYRTSCYQISLKYQTFEEAHSECTRYDGHLVTIDSDYEQAKITTIVAELGIHFYLGMKFNNETKSWEWTDGESVDYTHWAEFEPDMDDDDGSGLCVYMHRHEDIGFWKATSCSREMASICEYPRHSYTEPPPTTTTPPPEKKCPDDYGWVKWNDHCYKLFEESELNNGFGLSFEGGREFCKSKGGDLVTWGIWDEESNFEANTYYWASNNYWIGLRQYVQEGGEGEGYTWVDDTPFSYTNWLDGYPDSNDGVRNCIAKENVNYYGGLQWMNHDCAETMGVICEISASVEEITTAEPPTLPPPVPCGAGNPEGWVQQQDNSEFCYLLYSDALMFFDDANDYCKTQGGRLVTVHNNEENQFVRELFETNWISSGWLGITNRNTEGFETVDGSPADYFHWAPNEPNNADDSESCVSLGANSGEWNDVSCGAKLNFICKKPREGEFTTPATTSVPGGHCPSDWYEYEGRCYRIYGGDDLDQQRNWSDARDYCKSLTITRSMHRAELASIHSQIQSAFLVVETAKYSENGYWIGLNNLHSYWDGSFLWSDETKLDFTNWDYNEPNSQNYQQCVEMYGWHGSAGTWNDQDCTVLKPFICMVKAEDSIPTQGPIDYEPCRDETLASKGFFQLADNCYKFDESSMSWEGAENNCKEYGENVHLISMIDKLEENFAYVLSDLSDFWIGLKKTDDVWKWSDGWSADYTHWYDSEFTNGTCASFHYREARWFQEDCSWEKPFVCKYSENIAPTPPPRGPCPDGWFNYEDKCYYTQVDYYSALSWGDASIFCMQLEGANGKFPELASFHSQEQVDAVIKMLPDPSELGTYLGYWIGLQRTGNGFAWVDDSAVDFEYWRDGEPNDEHEFCVEADPYQNLKWNDNSCNQFRYPLCQTGIEVTSTEAPTTETQPPTQPASTTTQKSTPRTTTKEKTTEKPWTTAPKTTPRPDTTSTTTSGDNEITTTPQGDGNTKKSGMSGGAVTAVVIVVLAAAVLTSLVMFQLWNNNWDWRRIMPRNDTAPLLGKLSRTRPAAPEGGFPNMAYKSDTKSVVRTTPTAPTEIVPNILI